MPPLSRGGGGGGGGGAGWGFGELFLVGWIHGAIGGHRLLRCAYAW